MAGLVGENLGPYRILEQIGLGGMATVYKAYHAAMDRYVAIKVLPQHLARDPSFRARFEREARIIARLEHRFILPVYDVGEDEGVPYLVMRYTHSGDLSDLLSTQALTIAHAAWLISHVAEALAYAHRRGVIHRDVKPANVLLSGEGDVLLTDFGIAKIYEETLQLTGEGNMIGTPAYMAPEQLQGTTVDARTDIYALGVVLYQALTGECPFVAETPLAVALMHIHNPLRPPRQLNPNIPEALERIILRALAKNPADRFQTADELAETLRDALAGLSRQTDVVAAPVAESPDLLAAPAPPREPAPTAMPAAATTRRGLRRVPVWAWLVSGLVVAGLGLLASLVEIPSGGRSATATPAQLEAVPTGAAASAATSLPTEVSTAEPASTPQPTLTPTPTFGPIGESQPIPKGIVYLGDTETIALGFNMDLGGRIDSLRYDGRELVEVIQPWFYDGSRSRWYAVPEAMKVREYRTSDKSVYIKADREEGRDVNVASDVIIETWAWQRDGYFEVHIRATHSGTDTHAMSWQEFPGAYFAPSLTHEFGYFGTAPFTGAPIEELKLVEGGSGCPNAAPTENWAAFSTAGDLGLILAVPPQPYMLSDWALCWRTVTTPAQGWIAIPGVFDIPPGAIREKTFYLIPGPIDQGRAIVYDLIPHTTWSFDLNSLEGWHNTSEADTVENGILSAHLSPDRFLTSRADLRIPGAMTPAVTIRARAKDSGPNICLHFITAHDPYWDKDKSACVSVAPGEFQTYALDFSSNSSWNASVITQLGLTTSGPTTMDIDAVVVEINGHAWEFEVNGDPEAWVAAYHLASLQVSNGHLTAQSTGDDPYMYSPRFAVDAKACPIIEMRMKVSAGTTAQLFFITAADPTENEAKSSPFSVIGDGQFHTYKLDMSTMKGWDGTITQIRLDPTNTQASIEVDYIRIIKP
jgi:tRNA A-37 threonylcarbamoyl transferase component Bud32